MMVLRTVRLAIGGSLVAVALAAAAVLAVPAASTAAEEGRNTGIPAQADTKAAPATGTLFAVVNANGVLDRGKGAVSVAPGKFVGDYVVRFNGSVVNCAYTATIGLTGRSGTAAPGFITVAGSNNNTASVFVSTYNLDVRSAQRPFHLVVTCP